MISAERLLAFGLLPLSPVLHVLAACSEEQVQHGVAYGAIAAGCCGAPRKESILCDLAGGVEECRHVLAASATADIGASTFRGSWQDCQSRCEASADCLVWSLEPAVQQADGARRPALCRLAEEPAGCSPAFCELKGAASGRKDCEEVTVRRLSEGSEGPLLVEVVSEGYNSRNAGTAAFYLDGQQLSVSSGRGFTVVVLTSSGAFNSSHVFDTHDSSGSAPLIQFIEGLADGTPVLIAAKDDARAGLSSDAMDAIKTCGAELISGLHYRYAYALVGIKNGPALAEAMERRDKGEVRVRTAYVERSPMSWADIRWAPTTTPGPTTTPLPPCVEFRCPSGLMLREDVASLRGNDGSTCCEAVVDDVLGIAVKSAGWGSGNLATFYLNGQQFAFSPSRGMNVVVLRPDGTPVRSGERKPQTFDTNQVGQAANLTRFLDELEDGTVVLVAAKDEARAHLTPLAEEALKRCGATKIDSLGWRGAYALVGVKGGQALAEEIKARDQGMVVAIARMPIDPAAAPKASKPLCEARQANPPVKGWVANRQLELEAGCRYALWENQGVSSCLQGSWMTVVGGSNTVLMAIRLADMLAPEAIAPVRDGATMGSFTVVDVIIRGGRVVYSKHDKIDGCTALPYDAACKAGIAQLVEEAPAYDPTSGATRITVFEARFWDHADAAMDAIVADTRWKDAPLAMLVQVSTWYIYCASMKLSWCPRENLKRPELDHPQALELFKSHMAPVVSKMTTLCVQGGRAEKHGCWMATTSWQNPAPSRLQFYNDYNAAIVGALAGKLSPILRIIDLWTLGQAFPEQNVLGHGSPMLNLWNWQVMLGGMCPAELASKGTFAEFEGDLCFGHLANRVEIPGEPGKYDLAPATGAKCPNYWSACPIKGGSHLRCEPWECANSRPCTLKAIVKNDVKANLTGACYDALAPDFGPAAAAQQEAVCGRVWCDAQLQFLPALVAALLVVGLFGGSKLWERFAPKHLKEKFGAAEDPKKKAAEAKKAGGAAAAAAAEAPKKEKAVEATPDSPKREKADPTQAGVPTSPSGPGGPALLLNIRSHTTKETGNEAEVKDPGAKAPEPADAKEGQKPAETGEPGAKAPTEHPAGGDAVVVAVQDSGAKPPDAGVAPATAAATGAKDAAAAKKPKGAGDKFPLGLARMCASLHVVVGHLYAKGGVIPAVYAFGWGFTWVPWFFMLSGFVLFTAHLRRPKDEGVFEYVLRRSVTIYPLYAVSLIPAFAIAKYLDQAPSAIILVAQSWLLQAWVPLWTEKALQMHCWFLSAMVVYWFLFKPLSRCLKDFSLRATIALMAGLFFLPWLSVLVPALADQSFVWYKEHSGRSTDTWLDIAVVFLKFHPVCYLHVFVLGMLLAKLRLLLDAKAVAAGMPRRWRLPLEFVAPGGYAGLLLIFCVKDLQPWGFKLSTRLSVLLPFQAMVLFGLAGLPSLPQGKVAAFASRFDFLENYSYCVYVFQFIAYSVWPKKQDINLPLFLVFLLMTAVFVVHTVQRPVQKWWSKHPRARWGIPVVMSLMLGGMELFIPKPSANMDLPALVVHGADMVDVRLALVDPEGGGSLMNPSLLVKDGRVLVAARRHRLESEQRIDDGSCAAYKASGCTIVDQTWYSDIMLGSAPFDASAWARWPSTGVVPFEATVTPWSALSTPEGQPWRHLCVREEFEAQNNTLIRHIVTGPEDPKLVALPGGGVAVAFSSLPPLGADGCAASRGLAPVKQMYLAEHSQRPEEAVGLRLGYGSQTDDEKNWIPFAVNGSDRLHFTYQPLPHETISCEVGGNATCEQLHSHSFTPMQQFQRDHPGLVDWRGSAQAVLIEDAERRTPSLPRKHYLALMHAVERKSKRYVHYAYRFAAEAPHAVLQVSRQLPLQEARAESGGPAFAFASGLVVQDDVVAITYGAGDRDARALVLSLRHLDGLFACANATLSE